VPAVSRREAHALTPVRCACLVPFQNVSGRTITKVRETAYMRVRSRGPMPHLSRMNMLSASSICVVSSPALGTSPAPRSTRACLPHSRWTARASRRPRWGDPADPAWARRSAARASALPAGQWQAGRPVGGKRHSPRGTLARRQSDDQVLSVRRVPMNDPEDLPAELGKSSPSPGYRTRPARIRPHDAAERQFRESPGARHASPKNSGRPAGQTGLSTLRETVSALSRRPA